MNKIGFKTIKNTIEINIINEDIKEDLNNTNIINTQNIYFSEKYIKENLELVSSFLNVIILKNNINTINIQNNKITKIILLLINNLPNIKNLILSYDSSLTYDEFLLLLDNNYLNSLNTYDIPSYLLERIDINKNLEIKIRSEILFTSNFMEENKINTYSDLFYKKEISISTFYEKDYQDFDSFIEINKYLKIINLKSYSKKQYDYIFKKIISHNIKNIKIYIYQEYTNLNEAIKYITEFKKKYEEYILNNNIEFKIKYSDEFKKENTFKQINLNFIKICLLFIIISVNIMIGINLYRNYIDTKNYDNIESELNQLLLNLDLPEEKEEKDIIFIEPNDEDKEKLTETTTTIYDIKYEKVFEKLLEINKDTIGWLTVNNTNIDYPVVQSNNNDYYLQKDFYNNKNRHGWIFMDYRNSIEDLDDNTIIYGHNLANQKMFGTLRYASNASWYKKTNNQIITFNTLNQNMKWQIFSVYKVPVTNDYLIANFTNNEEKIEFFKMLKDRSIYDFNQFIDENTKILTLSTCSNGSKERLVVHAKLIN